MYEFHYKYIERNYDSKLLFTDTDSLVYEIKTWFLWRFLSRQNFFWFLWLQDTKFFYLVNKKVIGKMKDEFKRKIISDFVGLK